MAHAAQRIAPKIVPTEGAPKRPMPKAERRVQLLKIAYDMIDQDGIGALTMAGLAERSGAAKPVVYEHFSNSQEVIFCLLDDYCVVLDAAAATATKKEDKQIFKAEMADRMADLRANAANSHEPIRLGLPSDRTTDYKHVIVRVR